MEAYRDQYATLFNNGRGVVVLAVSADPDTTLINWFREIDSPIMVHGEPDGKVGRIYQTYNDSTKQNRRHLYVIDKTGKVTFKQQPVRVMVQETYDELAKEIDRLSPPPTPPGDRP